MCTVHTMALRSSCLSTASYAFTYVNRFSHNFKNKTTICSYFIFHFLHLVYHSAKQNKTYLEDQIYHAIYFFSFVSLLLYLTEILNS